MCPLHCRMMYDYGYLVAKGYARTDARTNISLGTVGLPYEYQGVRSTRSEY